MKPGSAVCAVEVAAVRGEPRDDAEQVTQVLLGEPVTVEEERDGWARVRTAYDYPGWVEAGALNPQPPSRVPGTFSTWLPAAADGDPVEEARRFLGTRYEWGGMTERGIDCSGLVHMAYRRTGRLVPRDADQQEAWGEQVAEDELRPGDLVCYDGHIAFWLGGGRILHATQRGGVDGVVEEEEPAELRPRFHRYVRITNVLTPPSA